MWGSTEVRGEHLRAASETYLAVSALVAGDGRAQRPLLDGRHRECECPLSNAVSREGDKLEPAKCKMVMWGKQDVAGREIESQTETRPWSMRPQLVRRGVEWGLGLVISVCALETTCRRAGVTARWGVVLEDRR